ncbi:ribonucleoside-diphosphate reductase subunit alpha [Egicoccus halophilus]|uniref:Ribonucleoside-diphosphate reductase n=1 Tax=Egicoccus halophilus TaxID=1670830 RepID=A0A8J3EUJ5_9ACTN|nr:ribonucleoside-diphosphate reductase subunit alpha [Egicoccus halophilus]GGI07331.1 ribonucleoside-diphosphate reductase [Egicoccus halophilus]
MTTLTLPDTGPAGADRPPTRPDAGPVDDVLVVRRDRTVVAFDATKIAVALTKAFLAVEGDEAAASSRVRAEVDALTDAVQRALVRYVGPGDVLHIEVIQDQVELALMRAGHQQVARAYVLYREARARARTAASVASTAPGGLALPSTDAATDALHVTDDDGGRAPLDTARLAQVVAEACEGLEDVDAQRVVDEAVRNLYDGIARRELSQALVLAARSLVETEPAYTYVSARLLLDELRREVLTTLVGTPTEATQAELGRRYGDVLRASVQRGIATGQLDPVLAEFDLDRLGDAIRPERDLQFTFLGLQTLYDRYLLHDADVRFELPQTFFLRIAMGLAEQEPGDRDARAIEFYELLSSFDFLASTPTLFNAGTTRPQLSSCFLTTVEDDLDGIFGAIKDNALLAKYSGGLGNDWTPVRGTGAWITGTNGRSSGIVPFLKIANDTAVAVNQGGKRKGAVCAYLETWHIDVEEFLDLRKNTGDDRRRTHDMNTANWVPDLFLQRVEADAHWTLFSPDEVGDLHDRYGKDFARAYEAYEAAAERGELTVHRRVRAKDLWRRMLTMLFETGHPWITFKDPCNLRSPQQHTGVVHSSNLCTEITLNTVATRPGPAAASDAEVAVCNLGSVNLARHVTAEGIDVERLRRTVTTAVRMLDNVIDINLYTIPAAERSNRRHRPIGLGLMGFADALTTLGLPYASEEAVTFADRSMELISHAAISASNDLAVERGSYASFEGSLWSQGVLPIDSLELLAQARDGDVELDRSTTLDWDALRERVRTSGMRNSNVMAIAPTATIANIAGVNPSIEPLFRNLYVKSNMSGEFTVVNADLVAELKDRGLWDEVMVGDLKYFDGQLGPIARIPDEVKERFATAFELDPMWLVRAAARRQKWIDQAQSLNLYVAEPNGRQLDELYRAAWRHGCKTTYYLRSQSRTAVEKSTLRGTDGKLNAVSPVVPAPDPTAACAVDDQDCEACQ